MNVRIALSTLVMIGTAAGPALAGGDGSGASPLALGTAYVSSELRGIVPVSNVQTTYKSIRYRPSYQHEKAYDFDKPDDGPTGYMQLYGGMFDPKGDLSNGATFGARIGANIDDHLQVGAQVDWMHRSDTRTALLGSEPLPGGGTVEQKRELSEVTSDLMPVLAFFQIAPSGTDNGPYFGVAGGYEALFVNATDFETGSDFSATFDGWGWQYYGGYAFPLTKSARLTVEGFGNQGKLSRDVSDPISGLPYKEEVDVAGGGVRGGLSWKF